ncbi:MAG: TetR/AcrR family transcriptional regulator [Planctomycetota bacterium]
MPRPRVSKVAEPTTDRILRAAAPAFAELGYLATKLADVAKAVGIRRPSLLYHFPTKDELYEAVIHSAFADLDRALQAAFALEGSFAAKLDAVVRGYEVFLERHPSFAPLILRELLDGQGPGRDRIVEEVVPLLDRIEAQIAAARGLRPGLPVREALVTLAASGLVRAAAGPLEAPVWGPSRSLPHLARTLLLREET